MQCDSPPARLVAVLSIAARWPSCAPRFPKKERQVQGSDFDLKRTGATSPAPANDQGAQSGTAEHLGNTLFLH